MTVPVAIDVLRQVGTICVSNGNLKLEFPEIARAGLLVAIAVLRNGKAEAIALLNKEGSRNADAGIPDIARGSASGVFSDSERNGDHRDCAVEVARSEIAELLALAYRRYCTIHRLGPGPQMTSGEVALANSDAESVHGVVP